MENSFLVHPVFHSLERLLSCSFHATPLMFNLSSQRDCKGNNFRYNFACRYLCIGLELRYHVKLLTNVYSLLHFIITSRYGLLFRTNIAGRHTVISADPEFNRFIFQQEGKLVVRQYLDSFEGVFKAGEFNGFTIHKYIRNMTLNQFGVDSIREKLISKFEQEVCSSLKSWCTQDSVEFKAASVAVSKHLKHCVFAN